jgi:hypothetical protein
MPEAVAARLGAGPDACQDLSACPGMDQSEDHFLTNKPICICSGFQRASCAEAASIEPCGRIRQAPRRADDPDREGS